MTTTPIPGSREWVARDFERTTLQHQLTILHDDGLYRHLRVAAPDSYIYGFDLVTWPGYLVISGDIGDWTFCRTADMFKFFRSSGGGINPDYWSEKVQVGAGGPAEVTRQFSESRVPAVLREWAEVACERWGIHGDPDWDYTTAMYPRLLADALVDELRYRETPFSVESTLRLLERMDADTREETRWATGHEVPIGFQDMWEWDFTEWESSFLRCCFAIVKGIALYDAHHAAVQQIKAA